MLQKSIPKYYDDRLAGMKKLTMQDLNGEFLK